MGIGHAAALGGQLECLGDFRNGQTAEEPKLDDRRLPLVQLGQPVEGIVESQHLVEVHLFLRHVRQDLGKGDPVQLAAPFLPTPSPRMVDEQPAHDPGSNGEEMCPALPRDL